MDNTVYLSLGSNLGDREGYLRQAIEFLNDDSSISVESVSSIYETDPVGYIDQPPFLNMVIKLQTSYSATRLLALIQTIEHRLKRKREIHWGPRTVDLDILLYNSESITTKTLRIPHPRMTERAFVMIPLREIAPDVTLPGWQFSLDQILSELQDKEGVRIWKRKNGDGVFELFES
ncbi:2-amino-4-hydroxy-6-hydroxymethyldihydropteridine diphosphokinase [Fictibacillus sp. Mic-4]|uniref:2-amino-4-hydroxy-6- hydroxymethyldihydropteridine diphosphokinase n=1 Tax=Fictibacillus TaxID=1329200 RepID=UPI00040871D2|nr:2-amino-4-hydroxy-6-hydroxymethyldihydropteridine diphosphokinase [Fictibacillus gelatini]